MHRTPAGGLRHEGQCRRCLIYQSAHGRRLRHKHQFCPDPPRNHSRLYKVTTHPGENATAVKMAATWDSQDRRLATRGAISDPRDCFRLLAKATASGRIGCTAAPWRLPDRDRADRVSGS